MRPGVPVWPPERLAGLEALRLRPRRPLKPDLSMLRIEGVPHALKDMRPLPWLLRVTLGRLQLRMEAATYLRLEGVPGVPRLRARVGRDALLLSFVAGQPLRKEAAPLLAADFFDRLEALIRAMHERGVVHLDLGQRKNILVAADGSPVILDFGSALGGLLPKPLGRILVRLLGWIDRRGLLMQRLRYGDGLPGEAERAALRRANRLRALWPVNRPSNPRKM